MTNKKTKTFVPVSLVGPCRVSAWVVPLKVVSTLNGFDLVGRMNDSRMNVFGLYYPRLSPPPLHTHYLRHDS